MTRAIDSTVLSRLTSYTFDGFILVEIDLGETNPRYLTTSPRDITYNSNTYLADGGLISIGAPDGTSILNDQSLAVVMVDSDGTIATAVNTKSLNGNNVEITAVVNDANGSPLLGSNQPFTFYKGAINGVTNSRTLDSHIFNFQISSPFADFDAVEPRVGSRDFQKRFIPSGQTDTSFDRVFIGVDEVTLGWGKI